MIPVVVLAGGKAKPELEKVIGTPHRSLAQALGKPLITHVTDALLSSGTTVESIVVVGAAPLNSPFFNIMDQGDFVSNLFAGLNRHQEAEFVLIVTADLPYITGEAVLTFTNEALELARMESACLVWPVVNAVDCYSRFPGIRRTTLRLQEGEVTGGNIALVSPQAILAQRETISIAFSARKSPIKLAQMLGFSTILRLFLSQNVSPQLLSIAWLERRVSFLLGTEARALVTSLPELATDIDRPSDFEALQ